MVDELSHNYWWTVELIDPRLAKWWLSVICFFSSGAKSIKCWLVPVCSLFNWWSNVLEVQSSGYPELANWLCRSPTSTTLCVVLSQKTQPFLDSPRPKSCDCSSALIAERQPAAWDPIPPAFQAQDVPGQCELSSVLPDGRSKICIKRQLLNWLATIDFFHQKNWRKLWFQGLDEKMVVS